MFAKGRNSIAVEARHNITDIQLASYYLGINKLPARISSPLREDKKPSFGVFTRDGVHVYYTDFSTGDKGSIVDLLQKIWGLSYEDTWLRISKELQDCGSVRVQKTLTNPKIQLLSENKAVIETHERKWEKRDEEYWSQFGISIKWLEFANVHPISHIIFVKEKGRIITPADPLAYAYVEFKEGHTTIKVYQPLNTKGFKWLNTHDRSVVSLWTKIPKTGEHLFICSSLKDALCLWANTGIPAIALQGEGYQMSETAIKELKKRYKNIYILYDNDEPGLLNSKKLSQQTGFKNVILSPFEGGKDISDLYKSQGKEKIIELIQKVL